MKKILSIIFFFCAIQLFAQKSIPKPNPPKLVVDNAGVLDSYDAEKLERKLVALDDSSSNQIAIVIVKTLNDEPIEDVATNTFRAWGIGNKKTNNGILILVAVDDRKIRIEVGYGLEGAIPDIVANDIINNDIKPAFRQQNYIGGLNKAVDDLSKAAVGEYTVKREKNQSSSNGSSILTFIIILFVVLLIVMRGGGGRSGGGGSGGGNSWIVPMLLGSMLSNSSRGSSWGGGGGDWGGGFGGFGGGSSGGGGASGGW
ncbi:MAG: YgcG family protein [Bacteroidetes bacterium]|nr:YgcG family protein [Bacteroidota bacterium]MBS1649894.1 YgcG family protein [Bacteroidota bacterium]